MDSNEKKSTLPVFWVRLGLAILVMILALVFNKYSVRSRIITAKDCPNQKCSFQSTEASISSNRNFYYPEKDFSFESGAYYRIIFEEKSDQDTQVVLNLSNDGDREMKVEEMSFKKDKNFSYKIVGFSPSDNFSKLFFSKKNIYDQSNITIRNINIIKLNISEKEDLEKLRDSVVGIVDYGVSGQNQTKDSSYIFSSLKQKKNILGQTFRADSNYLSGVGLNIDIAKLGDGGTRQYQLELQEVSYEGDKIKLIGVPIADLSFSIAQDIEKFRQDDGTFLFPITGLLEKGKDYMISIDNSKITVDDFNYLLVRGSKRDDAYKDGTAVVKQGKDIHKVSGDFYFAVYGASFSQNSDEKIMSGAVIADKGRGQGMYSYNTRGLPFDILDLSYETPDVRFNESKRIISGTAKNDSFFEYRVNTIYPIKNFVFKAEQVNYGWNRNMVFYSFDEKKWQEISYGLSAPQFSSSENNSDNSDVPIEDDSSQDSSISKNGREDKVQVFDQVIQNIPVGTKTIFFKITYDPQDARKGTGRYYGLKNVKMEGELIVK